MLLLETITWIGARNVEHRAVRLNGVLMTAEGCNYDQRKTYKPGMSLRKCKRCNKEVGDG